MGFDFFKFSFYFYYLSESKVNGLIIHKILYFLEPCCVNGKPSYPMPYECYPTLVPEDDPFYKQFGITCLDGTRSVDSKILNCNDVKPVIAVR